MLKKNKLVLLVLTFLTITSFLHLSAQQRTYSPLSRFGLGELQNVGYSSNNAMGNIGIGMRSVYGINNQNVASLTSLDSMSFYFDGGVNFYSQSQDTRSGSIVNSDLMFDHVGLAFSSSPNVSFAVGFKPVSAAGYKFLSKKTMEDNSISYSELSGSGNLSQAYLGVAVKPIENLSLGANISYLFGNLRNISKANFEGTAGALLHGVYDEVSISSMLYDFGVQYTQQLSDHEALTIGLTYRPKIGLKGEKTLFAGRGQVFGDANNLFDARPGLTVDTLSYQNGEFAAKEMEFAASYGLGVSYSIDNKLLLGADYLMEEWGDVNHLQQSFQYKNTSSYAVGAEYIPNDRAATGYLARVRYRAGAYYRENNIGQYKNAQSTLVSNDLYNYGITFGLGLPLKRSKTSVNLSVELGKRSADGNSDYKQSYGKLTANFSLHEVWFRKRQID